MFESKTHYELKDLEAFLACNLCNMVVKTPVVTPCGHLYCWKCIYLYHLDMRTDIFIDFCSCYTCGSDFKIIEVISLNINLSDAKEDTKESMIKEIVHDSSEKSEKEKDMSLDNEFMSLCSNKKKKKIYIPSPPKFISTNNEIFQSDNKGSIYFKTYGRTVLCYENIRRKNIRSFLSALAILLALVLYAIKNMIMEKRYGNFFDSQFPA